MSFYCVPMLPKYHSSIEIFLNFDLCVLGRYFAVQPEVEVTGQGQSYGLLCPLLQVQHNKTLMIGSYRSITCWLQYPMTDLLITAATRARLTDSLNIFLSLSNQHTVNLLMTTDLRWQGMSFPGSPQYPCLQMWHSKPRVLLRQLRHWPVIMSHTGPREGSTLP